MRPTVRRLVAQRLALGSVALFAPRTAGRLFGLDFEAHSQAAVLTRLFAVRHVALGAGLLLTDDGPARRSLVGMNLAVDVVDLLSVAAETRARSLPPISSVIGGLTAATATALGIAAVRDLQGPTDDTAPTTRRT